MRPIAPMAVAGIIAILFAACPHKTPHSIKHEDWKSTVSGGLLVGASVARIVANEADTTDGAIGCLVGETIGTTFRAAALELSGAINHASELNICACLAMRESWESVEVSAALVDQMQGALLGVSMMVNPQVKTCEGRAWLQSTTTALVQLVDPISSAASLEACLIPIPKLAPDLTHCGTEE